MTGSTVLFEPRGSETFTGERIHCAHWDGRVELRSRRVAILGTAQAVAQVLPPVVAQAEKVTVFQRESVWILPRLPAPGLARLVPQQLARCAARANLRRQVHDPWMRRQLTPEGKVDVQHHHHYYRALQQPNCRLVTWPVATLAPMGIRTVDGIEHRVDCIIFAHTDTGSDRVPRKSQEQR